MCVISLSSVKTLVCSNYFCHLLPTVANYCTNSLQGSNTHTQTHTFANTYTVRKSICKYHVTGQCPITWGQRGRGPAAWLDTTRDGQIGNRLFLTQVIRQPDRTRRAGAVTTAHQGWQVWCERVLRSRSHRTQWTQRMDGWEHIEKNGRMEGVQMLQGFFFRGLKCHSCKNVHQTSLKSLQCHRRLS